MSDSASVAHKPGQRMSVVQVLASALAALSASVIASFFGIAGTLAGAALVSVVATVAAALYSYSLRWVRAQVHSAAGPSGSGLDGAPTSRPLSTSGETGVEATVAALRERRRHFRWRRIALAALVAFVLAMTAVTLIELVTGGPISSHLPGGRHSGGTSIGNVIGGGGTARSPAKSPTVPEPPPETSTTATGPGSTVPSIAPSPLPSTMAPAPTPTSSTSTTSTSTTSTSTTTSSATSTTPGGTIRTAPLSPP